MAKRSTVHRCRTLRQQYDEVQEAWKNEREDLDFFYSGRTYDDPLHMRNPPSTTPKLRRLEARGAELERKMRQNGCAVPGTGRETNRRRMERALRKRNRKSPLPF